MTAIGFGTAFVMLLMLMAIIFIGGTLLKVVEDWFKDRSASVGEPTYDSRTHDRALAATVAVTALLTVRDQQRQTDDR